MEDDRDFLNHSNYPYPSFPSVSENYPVGENFSRDDISSNRQDHSAIENLYTKVTAITVYAIFIFGAVGNGAVIWLLGFQIKRNPFITYILNLAVADLGVLLSVIVYVTSYTGIFFAGPDAVVMASFYLVLLTYSASQFFVTAISIDRCVAVFCPLWYQCKRPPHLTNIVCATIWVLSTLLTAISCTLELLRLYKTGIERCYQFIANAVLCLPVMTVATGCLLIKFGFRAQQYRRRRLLTVVLLTLLFFLLFGFPVNVIYILYVFSHVQFYMLFASGLLICLNSSVNPVIYFLVARRRRSRPSESMKTMLQKVFKEEEICAEETKAETRV